MVRNGNSILLANEFCTWTKHLQPPVSRTNFFSQFSEINKVSFFLSRSLCGCCHSRSLYSLSIYLQFLSFETLFMLQYYAKTAMTNCLAYEMKIASYIEDKLKTPFNRKSFILFNANAHRPQRCKSITKVFVLVEYSMSLDCFVILLILDFNRERISNKSIYSSGDDKNKTKTKP